MAYIIYKCVWVAFWFGLLIYDWTDATSSWLIYLTSWSFLQIGISTLLQLTCALYFVKQKEKIDTVPALFKISWVVYNYSSNAAILVTLVYWITLYDGSGT